MPKISAASEVTPPVVALVDVGHCYLIAGEILNRFGQRLILCLSWESAGVTSIGKR
jgi:hypothetical protein